MLQIKYLNEFASPLYLSPYDTTALSLGSQVYIPFSLSPSLVSFDMSVPTPFLWWDASDTSTLTVDGSGYVSSWRSKTDTEGVGDKDLVQATSTRQPQSGTRTLNGLNVIDFDGVDDSLALSSAIPLTPPFQIFAVLKSDVIVTNTTYDYFYDGKGSTNRLIFYLNTNIYSWSNTTGNNSNTQTQTLDPFLHASKVSEESVDGWARFNGITDMYAGPTTQWDALTLGSRYDATGILNGFVAEFMIYDRALTDQEYWNVTNYLSQKWCKPEQPVVTAIAPSSGESVTLNWDTPLSVYPITDYKVQYSTDGSAWLTFDDGVNVYTNVTVTGLTSGTLYYFRVAGVNKAGLGTYSSTVTATPVATASISPIDFTPSLWLDASDSATITESGGSVSQWDDKSANGFSFTQATSANQPKTGTRTIGGVNALDFDGTDFLTEGPQRINNATDGSWTIFAVVQPDATNTSILLGADGSPRVAQFLRTNNNTYETIGFQTNGTSITDVGAAATVGTPAVLASVNAGSGTLELFVNGASVGGTAIASQTADLEEIAIGARNSSGNSPWDGLIGEVIAYDYVLTDAERYDVEKYLSDKWGVAL